MSSSIDVLRGQLLHLAQPGADHVCALLPALCPDLFVPGSKVEALRLKSNVVRVQSDSGGRMVSVVLKCLPRTVAERTALLITRWLPRIDLANAAPALLGTIPGDAYHWHVYEDLGTSELDASRPRLDVVAAAVDLIARLHTRAAGSALLAECQQHLDDLGMPYFASNVSEAIVTLEALSAAEHGFTGAERRVCTCLITRLNQLLDSLSRRTEFMRRCGGPYTLLHGDLWTINTVVVAGPEGPRARLIDWDRIGVGPVSYDLSTFLYRFPAAERSTILQQYRTAVARAGWDLPSDSDLNVLFETAECARYASRVIWPAIGLLDGTAEWGHWELAQILGWFEALEPVIPQ